MSKYFYEVSKHFSGDTELASKYMGVARTLLGGLKEMSGNVFQNARHVILADGAKISVSFAGAIAQVAIDARNVSDVVTKCRSFISGLLTPLNVVPVVGTGTEESPEYIALEWLYPSEYNKLVDKEHVEKFAVRKFADANLQRVGLETVPATYRYVSAGDYSGAMRKAVQLTLGMGVELYQQYTSSYAGTHGLVKKFGYTDDSPSFWIVRMPLAGGPILAMDFPVCSKVTKAQKDRGVHWIPTQVVTFPVDIAAVEAGKVIEIAADGLATATAGYAPTYSECGWAFSESGHECANVLVNLSSSPPATKLVTVAFSVYKGGLSASVTSSSPATYLGMKSTLPRFPQNGNIRPHFEAYEAPVPSGASIACPVHVFYKGETKQLFSYYYHTESASPETEGAYFNANSSLAYPMPPYVPVIGKYHGVSKHAGFTRNGYTINGAKVTSDDFSGNGLEYNFDIVAADPGNTSPYAGIYGSVAPPDNMFVRAPGQGVAEVNRYIRSYANRTPYPLLYVPFNQREGAYILDGLHVTLMSHNLYPHRFLGCVGGAGYALQIDNANGCGLLSPSVITIGAAPPTTPATYTPYLSYTNPELTPPVTRYGQGFIGAGGNLRVLALSGCYRDIYEPGSAVPEVPDAATVYTPMETEWSGGLTFYTSGGTVGLPFSATDDDGLSGNARSRILLITSTTYLNDGTVMAAVGQTDAFMPDKYIAFNTVNTNAGENAVTNTVYPVTDITSWVHSFVGIAN